MDLFDGVSFHGAFRDYQQAVLDHSRDYLADGRINIVASPGSGKTILGLELIRRQGKPALILSPSVVIRRQWGERFASGFLPEGADADRYVSFDLKRPGLLTSVTYQALHAAYNKAVLAEDQDDDDQPAESENEDFSGFDLFATIKKAGIGTICLDEAHHLRSEWQKALEGFVGALGGKIVLICLTATPPYDSDPVQWKRYSDLCGPVDEEISVPQLVAQKTLCPHQDYIYFSFPAGDETELLLSYRRNAEACVRQTAGGDILSRALAGAGVTAGSYRPEIVAQDPDSFRALVSTASLGSSAVPRKLIMRLFPLDRIPRPSLADAEKAFGFIVERPDIFGQDISDELYSVLSSASLTDKRRVCLTSSDKLDKMLISSSGKLSSINEIAAHESRQLGTALRLLILTDYIKRDLVSLVGTDGAINALGAVPVFESVRRTCGAKTRVGLLTGGPVIIPEDALPAARDLASADNADITAVKLPGTSHVSISFSGSEKSRVGVVTKLFESGLINILVGTKSLLGEGWDCPCINTLILASFVGSFMLSNQMRGRAIRTDKNVPDKTADIWHLVSVEEPAPALRDGGLPVDNSDGLPPGTDFEMLRRRFDGFLAPAYHRSVIENGIGRIDNIVPPYDKEGLARINNEMLTLSADRKAMAGSWNAVLKGKTHPEILVRSEIPEKVISRRGTAGIWAGIAVRVALAVLIFILSGLLPDKLGFLTVLIDICAGVYLGAGVLIRIVRLVRLSTPLRAIKTAAGCLLRALKDAGIVKDSGAQAQVTSDDGRVCCALKGACAHDKDIFSTAMGEMFSPIGEPRYLLVKKLVILGFPFYDHSQSFACPSVLSGKKETAEIFRRRLKPFRTGYELVYTKSENGRKILDECRRDSMLNIADLRVTSGKAVS